jgi:hypothetical protein
MGKTEQLRALALSRLRGRTAAPQRSALYPREVPLEFDRQRAESLSRTLRQINDSLETKDWSFYLSQIDGMSADDIGAQDWGYFDPVTNKVYWLAKTGWLVLCFPVSSQAGVRDYKVSIAGHDYGFQPQDVHGREAQIAALLVERKGFTHEAEHFRHLAGYLFDASIENRNRQWPERPPDPR